MFDRFLNHGNFLVGKNNDKCSVTQTTHQDVSREYKRPRLIRVYQSKYTDHQQSVRPDFRSEPDRVKRQESEEIIPSDLKKCIVVLSFKKRCVRNETYGEDHSINITTG